MLRKKPVVLCEVRYKVTQWSLLALQLVPDSRSCNAEHSASHPPCADIPASTRAVVERGSVKHVICKNNSRESQNTGTDFHNRRFKNFLLNGRKAEFKINSTCF